MTDNIIHLDAVQAQRDALVESLDTPFQSWAPEVLVAGKWYSNAVRLPDETSANLSALDLMYRWSAVEKTRSVPSTDPITYIWENNILIPVKPGDVA